MVTSLQSRNVCHSVLDNQCLSVMSQLDMGRKVLRITDAELICVIEESIALCILVSQAYVNCE